MIELPRFRIRDKELNILQGGMGVGVSSSGLASAVANCGGGGVIASVGLGSITPTSNDYVSSSNESFRKAIQDARSRTTGVIGVNIMRALTNCSELVRVATEEKADIIEMGAGLALDLPEMVVDPEIALVPMVSSARAAGLIIKVWGKKYSRRPDAFVVEGPLAGGHLGFKAEIFENNPIPKLEKIVSEVLDVAGDIPVIAAGGIYTGADIARYIGLGVKGVQMGTRFVTTKECDASDAFKREYLRAKEEDLIIIQSPVGMPGRAIKNPFLEEVMSGKRFQVKCRYKCLKTCDPKNSPYCIAKALIEARKGNLEEGFAFAGSNAWRATPENCLDENGEFITVETLMQRLSDEYKKATVA